MSFLSYNAQRLRDIIDELERSLEYNSEFQEWKILSEAWRKMSDRDRALEEQNAISRRAVAKRKANVSQADAAVLALDAAGIPLTTNELLELLPKYDAEVGGEKKAINLASNLSRDERLVSLNWGGGKAWWHSERNPPNDGHLKQR